VFNTKRHLVVAWLPLLLATLACGLIPGAVAEPQPPATVPLVLPTVTSIVATPGAEPLPTEPPAPPDPGADPPPAQPEGGFLGGTPLDPSSLPILPILPQGVGPLFCEGQFDGPAISIRNATNEQMQLCLYNFPVEPGSPDITVTLTHPDGTAYVETFTFVAEGESVRVEGLSGGTSGSIPAGDFAPPGPPSISIAIYTPANFPSAGWTGSASTADGGINVPPTPLTLERFGPQVSVLTDPAGVNPFIFPDQSFSAGGPVFVYGLGYDPNAQLTVAFYREDETLGQSDFGSPQLRPEYATVLTTDAGGQFVVQFAVVAATVRGSYFTVTDHAITADTPADPFAGRFSIE
jgi:hypothetical protein